MNPARLIQRAKKAQKYAIAPYSQFRVGAALLAKNGKVYTGCNVETSSYGLTLCAERVALFKALSEGERDFQALAIFTDAAKPCPPCGACRQVLWDFAKGLTVVMANSKGERQVSSLKNLLPDAFGAEFL